jgi:uncharacterized damage-inducible protein DinB
VDRVFAKFEEDAMSQAGALAEALQGLFSNPDAGWFTPLSVAIQELTPDQAAKVPAERFNSVWGVVNHVRFWQEYMLLRLQGKPVDRKALGGKSGWPLPPISPSEAEWDQAKERMFSANQSLAEYVSQLNDEALNQPLAPGRPSPYQVVQGLLAHNSYHTCEVISIRHMLGLWLEKT